MSAADGTSLPTVGQRIRHTIVTSYVGTVVEVRDVKALKPIVVRDDNGGEWYADVEQWESER